MSQQKCQGQHSIQNEINKIIKDSSKDWANKIRDNKYRDAIRMKLRATGADWCDYKANECACEQSFLSVKSTFERMI